MKYFLTAFIISLFAFIVSGCTPLKQAQAQNSSPVVVAGGFRAAVIAYVRENIQNVQEVRHV